MKLAAWQSRVVPWLPLLILLGFYVYLLANPINLTVVDLGRHIVNGREILHGNWQVLSENTYAYTMPRQPFVNHHWLTGVIFYLVYSISGFTGLHLFHTGLLLVMFALFFLLLKKNSNQQIAFALGSLALLFFASRTEIRPESFGLLILLIYLHIIHFIQKNKQLDWKTVGGLLALQVLWTNLHISFIFGPFVFGLLWIASLKEKSNSQLTSMLLKTWVGLSAITLLNPNGLAGTLAPFTILQDYGYRVFENQTLWFLRHWYPGPIIPLFYLTSTIVGINWLSPYIKTKPFNTLLAAIGIVLGFIALRNIPIFVVFTFPLLANQINQLAQRWRKKPPLKIEKPRALTTAVLVSVFAAVALTVHIHPAFGKWPPQETGFGLAHGQREMLDFLQTLPTSVRIFNNYDIGSALILALYPETPVFVDNRPEAFSPRFFQQQYVPMQESETTWQQAKELFDFQYLILGHRDLTSWTQTFITNRLQDPEWSVVYQDAWLVVFSRESTKIELPSTN